MSDVVKLVDHPSLADIPGQLRQLADAIERGDHGDVAGSVTVLLSPGEHGGKRVSVFGHGVADGWLGLSLLAMGMHELAAQQ